MNKKLKLTFARGAFDEFEGTQEELEELIKSIEKMVESGELEKNSKPLDLDELEKEDPELAQSLRDQLENFDKNTPRKFN
ncbi:MAG: hypothetical protein EBX47_09090 [Synechococcaceae bacterium WB8_1B_057]|nr:hypothetical protein [Synechococcaceae bacterium WB6_1A_059]NDG79568.1 hypothetical protein [Synechococcaceae bacterium WB8_1B_057]